MICGARFLRLVGCNALFGGFARVSFCFGGIGLGVCCVLSVLRSSLKFACGLGLVELLLVGLPR